MEQKSMGDGAIYIEVFEDSITCPINTFLTEKDYYPTSSDVYNYYEVNHMNSKSLRYINYFKKIFDDKGGDAFYYS